MQQQNIPIAILVGMYKRGELWATERYRDFLHGRRVDLAERMNSFIREKAKL